MVWHSVLPVSAHTGAQRLVKEVALDHCMSAACSLICTTAMTFVATFDALVPLPLIATTITIHSLEAENLTCACENA